MSGMDLLVPWLRLKGRFARFLAGIIALAIVSAGFPSAAQAATGHPSHHHSMDASQGDADFITLSAPEVSPDAPPPLHAAGAMECCDMAVGGCIASHAPPPDSASTLAAIGGEGVSPWDPRRTAGQVPDVDVPPPR